MKLVNIGFGNLVSADKVVAVVSPEVPHQADGQEAKEQGVLIGLSPRRHFLNCHYHGQRQRGALGHLAGNGCWAFEWQGGARAGRGGKT